MKTLRELSRVGESTEKLLNKIGIYTLEDLITYYPFRYNMIKRMDLKDGKVIVDGCVMSIPSVFYIRKTLNKIAFKMQIQGKLVNVVIFNRAYLRNRIHIGSIITLFGKYNTHKNMITVSDIYFKSLPPSTVLEPVYHVGYGLSNTRLASIVHANLTETDLLPDYIPSMYIEKYQLLSKKESVYELHHPTSAEKLKKARFRTKYEELFKFMMKMEYLKTNQSKKNGLIRNINWEIVDNFIANLPFNLTEDQITSVKDIYLDLVGNRRMNRLLQGDVGSGKTIVAIVAIYINFLGGYQSAMMAPTEILATQHYETVKKFFHGMDIKVTLLTGRMRASEKKKIYDQLALGHIDVVIGTHALINEKVIYNNLGLVVTDEQHRFGVLQRASLKNKGKTPDILYMSATPIPRTYALTLYGDMTVSNIKSVPSGRKEILTYIKKESEICEVLKAMYDQLQMGYQIYVIAPLIEESEKIDLMTVKELFDKMELAFGKKYNTGVLHGKLSASEKTEVMNDFVKGAIQILISTTVIEVGVDVPKATMIVIFDAFRFGLSTLHQLRGRVGRNHLQSYCYLISNFEKDRLKIMEQTGDGFKISEADFKLRGSGDLFGVKQSGDMKFMVANLQRDFSILVRIKKDVESYLKCHEGKIYIQKLILLSENLS